MTTYKLKQSVSTERLDGETIAIDFVSGRFFSFRESAADLLWLISEQVDVPSFAGVIRRYFDVSNDPDAIATEISTFIETLERLELIEPVTLSDESVRSDLRDISLPNDYDRSEWKNPLIISNDQLADLLKIDPIHDVSEGGWPDAPKI